MNTDKKDDPTEQSSADRTKFLMYAPEAKTVSVAGTFILQRPQRVDRHHASLHCA
jgi:1,4-alpha-glucan branching enzyme